ncbi:MAG TPA: hypothetical protein VFM33_09170 [Aquabacterium sp.]|nr:hypothetical protein [Aquabacterium sp.]
MKAMQWVRSASRIGLATVVMSSLAASALAGEVYTGVGLPGLMFGYAQAINPMFTVRADVATLGNYKKNATESGIDYQAKLAFTRLGIFGDYFPFSGGFRFSGGLTFNHQEIKLHSTAQAGSTVQIGNNSYLLTPDDHVDASVKFPSTTPYLGIGWGHQHGDKGFGFVADLGATIGKPKVEFKASGPVLDHASQSDIDQETQQLRDGVGKISFIPQISLGLNYRF